MGNRLSAARDSHIARKQARNAKPCNVQLSQQADEMTHERASEVLLSELALGSHSWKLYKVDMKYLNHNKEVVYR